jgi:hypothetical protein
MVFKACVRNRLSMHAAFLSQGSDFLLTVTQPR